MDRIKVRGELVTFYSSIGQRIDGIFYQNDENSTTVIHIHGSLGNFYHNQFIRLMADKYLARRTNLLSFNLTSHDGIGEGFRGKEFSYIGGSIVDFNTCLYDIDGAIAFSRKFSDKILLQGHSLGCDRVLHFIIKNKYDYDFILLAPCDSFQLQTNWLVSETVGQQIERLKKEMVADKEFDWLDVREYGVRQNDEEYVIPITRKALLSIMEGPVFQLINIKNPAKFQLNQRAFIYISGKDPLQTESSDVMFNYFEQRIHSVTKYFAPNGDHDLGGCEDSVINAILTWISR